MKLFRVICTLTIVILTISFTVLISSSASGFYTCDTSEQKKTIFLSNVGLALLLSEPKKSPISCFDISENLFAVGCENYDKKTVCVYSKDGDFKYGYEFNCSGSFGIKIESDYLKIFFVRSDIELTVDKVGNVESVKEIPNTVENNRYWNYSLSVRKTINNNEFVLKNETFLSTVLSSSFSKLVMLKSDGGEEVIYSVGVEPYKQKLLLVVGIIAFFCITIIVVIKTKGNWNKYSFPKR